MTALIRSWVDSANEPDTEFPLNNLPYGVMRSATGAPHCCTAIGTRILDLTALEADGHVEISGDNVLGSGNWTDFMPLGPNVWADLRAQLTDFLADGSNAQNRIARYLSPLAKAELLMPFQVTEYTDFYSSRHHATNVGTMFRGPENALPPNWLHIPIGYNGRASSVVVSGTPIERPWGQLKGPDDTAPRLAPSERFDIELEMGAIVGVPSEGPLSVQDAHDNIFGFVLLNDWSARDIQAWEYQPLGPFQSKATATTISPWIVTKAALEPFRCDTPERVCDLLPHIRDAGPMLYDIDLTVRLTLRSGSDTLICRTNYNEMYYSAAQQLAHHSSCGCPMRAGDLLGSGTISGPERENRGSLLELSWGGKDPIELADGGVRRFLEDGDTVTVNGQSTGNGYRVGFGECSGQVTAARRAMPAT